MSGIQLYGYWRSSCSYRVRICLELKSLKYDYQAVNLLKNEQKSEQNLERNTSGLVPTLVVNDFAIQQSMAIMMYLEEVFPATPLLPAKPNAKAVVMAMCCIICCDTQPLQNLKILKRVPDKQAWAVQVITEGLAAYEALAVQHAGVYSYGDSMTMADACLVPQVYNAKRFDVDMSKYPTIERIMASLEKEEAVKRAHPSEMPDAQ